MCSSRKSEVVAMTDKETLKESQYADQLRVKPKVLRYMEVLLWLPKTNAAKGIYQKSSEKKHISPRKIEYTFSLLHYDGFSIAEKEKYYVRRKARNDEADQLYSDILEEETDGLYILDIIRGGIQNDDPRIPRNLSE